MEKEELKVINLMETNFSRVERPEDLSPLVLAYVGDAVFELAVRSFLVSQGRVKVGQLHRETVSYVNAGAQAVALRAMEEFLTEEEKGVVRRGRNTKSGQAPRHTQVRDYRQSTGFECLVGFLYLKGEGRRLEMILNRVLEQTPDKVGD